MDDLTRPLGLDQTDKPSQLRRFAMPLAAGALGVILAVFAVWALVGSDSRGGEPMVVVSAGLKADDPSPLDRRPPDALRTDGTRTDRGAGRVGAAAEAARLPTAAPGHDPGGPGAPRGDTPAAGQDQQVVTIIDGRTGSRQEVRIPASGPAEPAGGAAQLIEMTRNGPIPRIGPDGLRAAQAYARPVTTKPGSMQIAIVLAGLGISANGTTEAINKLPGPITFAFASYGPDLDRVTDRARNLGHEVLLQVAMEPFDYPDNDPGPQTLLTSLSADQNIERLQWAMSRFQGYVGIINQMGARFTTSELAFAPIMREIGRRGLIYIDDGSSQRSLAGQIAGGARLAFAKADVVLDSVPTTVDIDRALVRLEGMAHENGLATGVASALPVSIERIARWAMSADSRGFTLVPITAAAAYGKSN